MPSKYRTHFFDEPRDSSLIKLRVLQKFLVPWSAKVGSPPDIDKIWVVDAFAGPGAYKDDNRTAGSPKLILNRALQVQERPESFRIGCVFVEKDRALGAQLDRLCSEYPDVDRRVVHGDFWEHTDEIIAIVGSKPLLLLVDPFGVMGLDYEVLGRLVQSTRKCDLIATFVDVAIPRLESQYPSEIERAIGPRRAGEPPAVSFARNMAVQGSFLPGGRFPIRQSFDSAKSYELIFFSRSFHAYRLWNDSVTREWENLKRSTLAERQARSVQPRLTGIPAWENEIDLLDHRRGAADAILTWAETRGVSFNRMELIEHFVVHRFGEFHTSTLRIALTLLEDEGRLHCARDGKVRADYRVWRLAT